MPRPKAAPAEKATPKPTPALTAIIKAPSFGEETTRRADTLRTAMEFCRLFPPAYGQSRSAETRGDDIEDDLSVEVLMAREETTLAAFRCLTRAFGETL